MQSNSINTESNGNGCLADTRSESVTNFSSTKLHSSDSEDVMSKRSSVQATRADSCHADELAIGNSVSKPKSFPVRPYSILARRRMPRLLDWNEVPCHLQFNPYVLTGYRHLLSSWGCLHSLFYLHNETVNIFTHGIPIIYIVLVVPSLLPWDGRACVRFLSWCHLMGALAPWCGSFLYHLFMNHSRGVHLYRRLLQLDMLGIWVSQSFGALPMVTATVYCSPWFLRYSVILFYCVLCLWGLYKAMTAWSPWQRRLCFLLPFVMRIVLAGLRAARMGGGDPASMKHVILQDVVSVVGGLIGAMNIPERWFPGTFDYCLNSHNIMHILVVSAVYSMHQVTVQDLNWMTHTRCQSGEEKSMLWQEL